MLLKFMAGSRAELIEEIEVSAALDVCAALDAKTKNGLRPAGP
jgi:hypothetical protein